MQANAMGMRAKIQTMDMKQTQTVRLLDVLRLIIWLDELPLIYKNDAGMSSSPARIPRSLLKCVRLIYLPNTPISSSRGLRPGVMRSPLSLQVHALAGQADPTSEHVLRLRFQACEYGRQA